MPAEKPENAMSLKISAVSESSHPHRILPVFSDDLSSDYKTSDDSASDDSASVDAGWERVFGRLKEPWSTAARETAAFRRFRGEREQTLLLPYGAEQWLFTGLGDRAGLTPHCFSEALARAFAELHQTGARRMAAFLPDGLPWNEQRTARLAAEAFWMAAYQFNHYRSESPAAQSPEGLDVVVELVAGPADEDRAARKKILARLAEGVKKAEAVGRGIHLARDLINHPAAVATPDFLLEEARRVGRECGAKLRIIRGDELAREGYGAIYAVGRASEAPPALAALEYGRPGPDSPTVALVGKGVTFDTGGLDIKPSSSMALMKKDMGGAATVLGAFAAVAGLGLPVHLVAVLGLAENSVDARSYRPGDILSTKAGKTVEVTNTDAEGRLVLADALALAGEYSPRAMIDFATLTGACRIALGKDVMGLFCDDRKLGGALEEAARLSGDHLWPLPLWQPYRRMLKSPLADLVNASQESFAGAITAALFLQEFAGKTPWAHIDCYAWSDGDSPLFPKGGSGMGVRLVCELLEAGSWLE